MGFKETFTRSGEDNNLQYDDTAFLYFSLSCFVLVLVPLLYDLFRRCVSSPLQDKTRIARNPSLNAKVSLVATREKHDRVDRYLVLRVLLILVLSLGLFENIMRLSEVEGTIKSFDPYDTLGVTPASTVPEIKRAYRKLSLVYHPDKNPDDPLATAKFILITKAYNCLTDESMKDVCAKYGNPDGPGSFSVAVALPSFLLNKDNQVLVLILFFLLFLIVIPTLVYLWYIQQGNTGPDGILIENKQSYYRHLNENTIFKNITEIMATSQEFRALPVNSEKEGQELQKLMSDLSNEYSITKPKLEIYQLKAYLLIQAHLHRHPVGPESKEQQYRVLKQACRLSGQLVDFASKIPPNIKDIKYCGVRCVNTLVDYQQCLAQGLKQNSEQIEQLVFFDEERLERTTKRIKRVPGLAQLIQNDESCDKLYGLFSEEEQAMLKQEVALLPKVQVKTKVEVTDENQIVEGDIVSIKVDIYRTHLASQAEKAGLVKEGEVDQLKTRLAALLKSKKEDYVHNPYNPVLLEGGFHIMLADVRRNMIFFMKHVNSQAGLIETNIQFRAPFHGLFEWTVFVRSDSYRGLDHEVPIKINVLSEKQVKREIFTHPDDIALDREPSFMQSLMINAGIGQSDDELEDEEEEVQRLKKKLREQGEDSDEWDDQEEEEQEEEDKKQR